MKNNIFSMDICIIRLHNDDLIMLGLHTLALKVLLVSL